ncbi:unnamed protein product [Penicillium egyptiacum]|uniref:Mago nashi domain protein n=1 Tax=Penicillium egyptiacum TaxID=1303716 RepID=A0A9W4PA97_9EURO|nr:unnamed protein product [Penicillium egyptiacum]
MTKPQPAAFQLPLRRRLLSLSIHLRPLRLRFAKMSNENFYLRYYSGHSGRFGHEFLEFDLRTISEGSSAAVRYANNSNYRNDSLIRKESEQEHTYRKEKRAQADRVIVCVSDAMVEEVKRIIKDSEILKEDDSKWPQKNKDGRQELEIRIGNEHISFETAKIGSLVDVTESDDPEGLRVFYYLVQDLKALVFSLISLHFKVLSILSPCFGTSFDHSLLYRSSPSKS